MENWTTNDVIGWLKKNNLQEFVVPIQSGRIDGMSLVHVDKDSLQSPAFKSVPKAKKDMFLKLMKSVEDDRRNANKTTGNDKKKQETVKPQAPPPAPMQHARREPAPLPTGGQADDEVEYLDDDDEWDEDDPDGIYDNDPPLQPPPTASRQMPPPPKVGPSTDSDAESSDYEEPTSPTLAPRAVPPPTPTRALQPPDVPPEESDGDTMYETPETKVHPPRGGTDVGGGGGQPAATRAPPVPSPPSTEPRHHPATDGEVVYRDDATYEETEAPPVVPPPRAAQQPPTRSIPAPPMSSCSSTAVPAVPPPVAGKFAPRTPAGAPSSRAAPPPPPPSSSTPSTTRQANVVDDDETYEETEQPTTAKLSPRGPAATPVTARPQVPQPPVQSPVPQPPVQSPSRKSDSGDDMYEETEKEPSHPPSGRGPALRAPLPLPPASRGGLQPSSQGVADNDYELDEEGPQVLPQRKLLLPPLQVARPPSADSDYEIIDKPPIVTKIVNEPPPTPTRSVDGRPPAPIPQSTVSGGSCSLPKSVRSGIPAPKQAPAQQDNNDNLYESEESFNRQDDEEEYEDPSDESPPPRKPPPLPADKILNGGGDKRQKIAGARGSPGGGAAPGFGLNSMTLKGVLLRPTVLPSAKPVTAPAAPAAVSSSNGKEPKGVSGILAKFQQAAATNPGPPVPKKQPPARPVNAHVDVAPGGPPPPRKDRDKSPPGSPPSSGGPTATRAPVPRTPITQSDPNDISSQPWYSGDCGRESANKTLKKSSDEGCFLVRDSEKSGQPYTLCIVHNTEIYNIAIRKIKGSGKYALGTEKPDEHVFDSVVDMIKFHKNNAIEVSKANVFGKVKLTKIAQK